MTGKYLRDRADIMASEEYILNPRITVTNVTQIGENHKNEKENTET